MNDLHYAVVVGIDRYPGWRDLRGAKSDAREFAAWLRSSDGGDLPEANVHRVVKQATEEATYKTFVDARPTKEEVDSALLDITASIERALKASPGRWQESRLYLYVAGHGFAPPSSEGALLLANASHGAWTRNLELVEYRRWCTFCAWFREVVVFADCCRWTGPSEARGTGPGLDFRENPLVKRTMRGSLSTLVAFGARLDQPTYEAPEGHDDDVRGYFTRSLLKGLRGGAADDHTGAVTAASLAGFVDAAVREATQNKKHPQSVEFVGDLARATSMTFGPAQRRPTRWVTIAFPPGLTGAVNVLDGRLNPIAHHDIAAGPLKLKLEDGLYSVKPVDPPGALQPASQVYLTVAGEDLNVHL